MTNNQKSSPEDKLEAFKLPQLMLNWVGPDYPTREKMPLMRYFLPCYPFKDKILY